MLFNGKYISLSNSSIMAKIASTGWNSHTHFYNKDLVPYFQICSLLEATNWQNRDFKIT
jgi:hypothetical protein